MRIDSRKSSQNLMPIRRSIVSIAWDTAWEESSAGLLWLSFGPRNWAVWSCSHHQTADHRSQLPRPTAWVECYVPFGNSPRPLTALSIHYRPPRGSMWVSSQLDMTRSSRRKARKWMPPMTTQLCLRGTLGFSSAEIRRRWSAAFSEPAPLVPSALLPQPEQCPRLTLSRLWITSAAAGSGGRQPRKPPVFLAVAEVGC